MRLKRRPSKILCNLVLLQMVVALACTRAPDINGEFNVGFDWENGHFQKCDVKDPRSGLEALPSIAKHIPVIISPIVREEMTNANLRSGSGLLRVQIIGRSAPIIKQFEITRPSFENLDNAVEHQDTDAIQRIVGQEHNINQRQLPSQNTALEIASAGGLVKSIRTLLDLGADPNIANTNGDTPLMMAILSGNSQAVKMLIDAGANVNAANIKGQSAVSLAKKLGRENLLGTSR